MNTIDVQSKNLLPFILSLPQDKIKYHEILKSDQSISIKSGLIQLQSGQDIGSHTTGRHEELLIILDGVGEIDVEGLGRQRVQKGSIAYIPPATQHNVYNVDTQQLRYLYIVASVE